MSEALTIREPCRSTLKLLRSPVLNPREKARGQGDGLSATLGPWLPASMVPTSDPASVQFTIPAGKNKCPAPVELLLVADAPADTLDLLRPSFSAPAHRVCVVGLEEIEDNDVHIATSDVIVLDVDASDLFDLQIFDRVRVINPQAPIVVVTSDLRAAAPIEAMKRGAFDFLLKPLSPNQFRLVVGRAVEVAHHIRRSGTKENTGDGDSHSAFVGSCAGMQEVYKAIGRVATQDVPVLITGESGTGKELVARAIYQHSKRADKPFLALNCAAIPEQLLESELFGHEKGAFTGADRRRIGKFEQCNGGTIFLDEVGDMPAALQGKVLRLLQEQTFERVGGNETIRTNVRLIAATHRDLKSWAAEGKFRPDLYYRLGVFTLHLPPLRERSNDLAVLMEHFVRRFSRELARDVIEVAPAALERLRAYQWPGNVRELQSVLKQALLRASGPVLLEAFLPDSFDRLAVPGSCSSSAQLPALEAFVRKQLDTGTKNLYEDVHSRVDHILLPLVMEHTGGNQSHAADCLGIARQTVRQRLRELEPMDVRPEGDAEDGSPDRILGTDDVVFQPTRSITKVPTGGKSLTNYGWTKSFQDSIQPPHSAEMA